MYTYEMYFSVNNCYSTSRSRRRRPGPLETSFVPQFHGCTVNISWIREVR